MELKMIETKEKFLSIKIKWNQIMHTMKDSTPFQSWEWNYHWWEKYESRESVLFVIEAFEGQDTFGYAPLIMKNRKICFIGDKHFDYGMFICAERKREIIELFWTKIDELCVQYHATVFFQCIPMFGDQLALFRERTEKSNKSILRLQVDTANINLNEYNGFEGYYKAISSSLRKKGIKPCLKADLEYQIEAYSEDVWRDIADIYIDRQEDRIGTSTLEWAQPIVKAMSEAGMLKISTLKYNGNRVAYLLFYEIDNVDYVWLTAFKKTEKFQLGHYIRYCLILRAYEKNIVQVDMMRGAYDYKRQWDCNVSSNYEYITFNSALGKKKYLLFKKYRKLMRDIVYNNKIFYQFYKKHSK